VLIARATFAELQARSKLWIFLPKIFLHFFSLKNNNDFFKHFTDSQ
jgi:hypothetical protein